MKYIISYVLALVAVTLTAATASAQDYDFTTDDGLYLKITSTSDTIEANLVGMALSQGDRDMSLSPVIEYRNAPVRIVKIDLTLDLPTKVGNTLTIPDGIQIASLRSAPFINFNLPEDVALMNVIQGNSYIQSITLPDDITAIPDNAFNGCSSLMTISLPPTVTVIGDYSFNGCSSLTSIDGLDNITSVGNHAFSGCSNIKALLFSPNLKNLGASAFENCKALTDINIGSVKTIKAYTFNHTGITSIDFLNDITRIERFGLAYLTLEDANLPNSLTGLGSGTIGGDIKRIRLGDSMKGLYQNSFTGIGWYRTHNGDRNWDSAFSGYLYNLEYIDFNKAETVHMGAFYHMDSLKTLIFPPTVKTIYCDRAHDYEDWGYFTGFTCSVTIQDSHQPLLLHGSSGAYFKGNVYLGRSLVGDTYSDYDSPFRNVTTLTLGNLVEHLPGNTFNFCDALEIKLPDNLRTIGAKCFKATTNTELILPAKMDTIGAKAFGDTPNLQKVISLAKEPPVCDPDLFTSMIYAFATLEVPDVEAYRNAPGWKNFRNIVTSGIDDPLADPSAPVISVEEGAIKVSGTGPAEIYSADGRLIYRGSPAAIPALPRGLYIVRAGTASLKLTL